MNFRQVRKKISTVSNVRQITKAMQMVAAVKMRKSQEVALAGQIYRDKLNMLVRRVISGSTNIKNPYLTEKQTDTSQKNLYVVISSNKGLCGSFNSSLFKHIFANVKIEQGVFITVGKKGAELLSRVHGEIIADFSKNTPFINAVSAIFASIGEAYLFGSCRNVFIVYNAYLSALKYQPTISQLLPIGSKTMIDFNQDSSNNSFPMISYEIEPSVEEVMAALIVEYLEDRIRGAIQESTAAEHAARMMAMKNATDNASDIIATLTLLRNKLRQASITNELLDATTAKISTEN